MKKPLLILIFLSLFYQLVCQIPISDSLELFYPFSQIDDSIVYDYSGNQINGTAYDATTILDRFGYDDEALLFNGESSKIVFNPDSLLFESYTYAVWVITEELPNWGTAGFILDIGSDYGVDQYITYTNSYSNYYLDGILAQGYNTDGSSSWISQNEFLDFNIWYFVVYTRSYDFLKLYINGEIVDSLEISSQLPIYGQSAKGLIGCRNTMSQYFKGGIDDVRIYSYALSKETINELFNQTVVAVKENNITGITLFPNPCTNYLSLETNVKDLSDIRIFDFYGRIVFESDFKAELNLGHLDNGLYIIYVFDKNGIIAGSEMVVIH